MPLHQEAGRATSRRAPATSLAALFTLALTTSLLGACGGGGGGSGADTAATASASAGTEPSAPAATGGDADGRIVAISTKAPLSTSAVTTSDLTHLTPLQVVQKIFHDQVDWYPGNNDPYSGATRAWAGYATNHFFDSTRTFSQSYAALQAAILADARRADPSIPVGGHPFPRAVYRAPTLSWMEALTETQNAGRVDSTAATLRLTPLQAAQQIFHDLIDWYPGNNNPNSAEMTGWGQRASNEFFIAGRPYQEAYSLLQAEILRSARPYDPRIPVAGHPPSRAYYNAPTLPWMSAALDTDTSAGGVTAPVPVQAATSRTINTVDTVVNDMKLRNDAVLRGYEGRTTGWYVGPGHVMIGNAARLTNTPNWWKNANPGQASSEGLRAMLPWVVIFDGVGHNAWNTRVQMRNFRAYYKSRSSGQWQSLGHSAGVAGAVYGKSTLFGATVGETRRTNADGSSEVKPPSDSNVAWHGWWQRGRVSIPPDDIAALFVTLQARLVVDNPSQTDDRSRARYLVQVGADYYRNTTASWPFVIPSAMTARSKMVTNDWQAFSATTFSNVGVQEPGGGITEAAFRAAPPPLE